MKTIVIAGGSGFLGEVLSRYFTACGFKIIILTRHPKFGPGPVEHLYWDGKNPGEWTRALNGSSALINLAGRTVDCRYTARNRKDILHSRVESTRVLGETIHRCPNPPPVWLNSSTATIYKHRFDDAADEAGEIGATPEAKDEFSVEVARAWERALEEADTPRTRKIALRSAMVLGHGRNSVFPTLLRLVRCGLGGKMGSGRQYVSWIHEEDFCRAVEWIIERDALSGPVNLAAANPLPNAEMMSILRDLCGMPFGLPASPWMLELGAFLLRTETELIIKSRRVTSRKLLESGFEFRFKNLKEAFSNLMP